MKSVIKSNTDDKDVVIVDDDSLSEADKRLLRHNWGDYPPSDWEWLEGELHDYIDGIEVFKEEFSSLTDGILYSFRARSIRVKYQETETPEELEESLGAR